MSDRDQIRSGDRPDTLSRVVTAACLVAVLALTALASLAAGTL